MTREIGIQDVNAVRKVTSGGAYVLGSREENLPKASSCSNEFPLAPALCQKTHKVTVYVGVLECACKHQTKVSFLRTRIQKD